MNAARVKQPVIYVAGLAGGKGVPISHITDRYSAPQIETLYKDLEREFTFGQHTLAEKLDKVFHSHGIIITLELENESQNEWELVGMVTLLPNYTLGESVGVVKEHVVKECYRRHGYGRMLMLELIETAENLCPKLTHLELTRANHAAQVADNTLYRRLGFTPWVENDTTTLYRKILDSA